MGGGGGEGEGGEEEEEEETMKQAGDPSVQTLCAQVAGCRTGQETALKQYRDLPSCLPPRDKDPNESFSRRPRTL